MMEKLHRAAQSATLRMLSYSAFLEWVSALRLWSDLGGCDLAMVLFSIFEASEWPFLS